MDWIFILKIAIPAMTAVLGAIIGGLIALIVIYYIVNYKLRGKKIRAATAVQPEDK